MASNIPVSTLSASLTLDVAGFATGVKQAEVLSRRLAKAQAEGLGGPALRRLGGEGVAQQVIRAQEMRIRAASNPDLQGPVRLRAGAIDAEISSEMAMRVQATQRRLEIERQTEASVSALRGQAGEADAAEQMRLASEVADFREESMRRVALREAANLGAQETARENAAQEIRRNAEIEAQSYRSASQKAEDRWEEEIKMIERAKVASTTMLTQIAGARGVGLPSAQDSAFNQLPENFSSLAPKAAAAQYALQSIGNTSSDSQKKMRDFNMRILQGGYQLQDFVVQVGSGTNALVAFAQQGAQMAGFFGSTGAWVGVGLAVASLATNMLLMSMNSKEAAKEVKSLTEETNNLLKARRGLIEAERAGTRNKFPGESEMKVTQARRFFSESDFREADAEVKRLQVIVDKRKKEQADYKAIGDRNPNNPDGVIGSAFMSVATAPTEKNLSAVTQAETDLVEARKKRAEMTKQATDAEENAVQGLNQSRKAILDVLFPDRKPLVDETTVSALIKTTALTEQQIQSYRTLLQIQKLRADSDVLSGKTNAEQVEILRRQSAEIRRRGLEESEAGKEVSKQLRDSERSAKLEARGYLDQLFPLRAKRRELENIRKLESEGLLPAIQLKTAQIKKYADSLALVPGNIDLTKRAQVRNADGSFSTEQSFSAMIDGKETLLPRIINGVLKTEKEAIAHFLKTGEHLGQYASVEAANQAAKAIHGRFTMVSEMVQLRYIDAARRSLKIPDVLTMTSGAMSSGGMTGNASATTLIEANRKMLSALEKIVNNTAMMAGLN